MRLTCPNCGAQYEVPDEVIPETGRDVQCSNCGDTWFQNHPDHPPAEEADDADTQHPGWDSPEEEPETEFAPEEPDEPAELDFAPEDEPEPESDAEDEADFGDDDEDEAWDEDVSEDAVRDDSDDDVEFAPEEEESPPRRGLDPAIADVLRQEAAREEEVRASEGGGGLETQPDLGLDDQSEESDRRSQQARSRMARLRGLPEDGGDDAAPEPDPDLISRRNLLPDIDEINSSLDSESARAEAGSGSGSAMAGNAAVAGKSGFNRGFMLIVLLVLILVLLYMLAPVIAEKVPALAGVLSAYVDGVNSGRLWLNDMIGSGAVAQ